MKKLLLLLLVIVAGCNKPEPQVPAQQLTANEKAALLIPKILVNSKVYRFKKVAAGNPIDENFLRVAEQGLGSYRNKIEDSLNIRQYNPPTGIYQAIQVFSIGNIVRFQGITTSGGDGSDFEIVP